MSKIIISEDSIKKISNIFIGDSENLYTYKSGSQIFHFFNKNFGYHDVYSFNEAHPSRWIICSNKIIDLINKNNFTRFLNIILSLDYIQNEFSSLPIDEIAKKQEAIKNTLNLFLKDDFLKIVKVNKLFNLIALKDDEVFVGSGGFAECYLIKSLNLVEKRLNENLYTNEKIVSRFKREFDITKSLEGLNGIIRVFEFNPKKLSYTMEFCDCDLYKYVTENTFTIENKELIISQILNTMNEVHSKNIVHRDLSPRNILIKDNLLKISDFGLGKNFDLIYSQETTNTNNYGKLYYCDPRQLNRLKEGDFYSDIYSIGILINFIMTKEPLNFSHEFKSISEKATASSVNLRYENISHIIDAFNKKVASLIDSDNKVEIEQKIKNNNIDEIVSDYVDVFNSEELFNRLQNQNFLNFYEKYIDSSFVNDEVLQEKMSRFSEYVLSKNISFKESDALGYFSIFVLLDDKFSYPTKEIMKNILLIPLKYNRFTIINEVRKKIIGNIDPTLELFLTQYCE